MVEVEPFNQLDEAITCRIPQATTVWHFQVPGKSRNRKLTHYRKPPRVDTMLSGDYRSK